MYSTTGPKEKVTKIFWTSIFLIITNKLYNMYMKCLQELQEL